MQSHSSMVTIGRAVYSKFVKIDLPDLRAAVLVAVAWVVVLAAVALVAEAASAVEQASVVALVDVEGMAVDTVVPQAVAMMLPLLPLHQTLSPISLRLVGNEAS